MCYAASRFSRVLRFSPGAILMLAMPLLTACAPACEVVNSWPWGTCYSNIHGNNSAELNSEFDEPPAAAYADIVERAQPLVRTYIVAENLPGLSLAVGAAGEIVWAEGFGWADIEDRRPVTPRTLFRIGGIARSITSVAAGLLLERGELDIDLPASMYVPDFPEKRWVFTTRQLMADVAGIRHYGEYEEMLYQRASCTGPLDALMLYADDPLLFEPGTAHEYSGYGWMLVAAVVEAVAGEPFLDFMQREIFGPLRMDDTVLDDSARPASETTSFYWPFAAVDTTTGIENANNPDNTCLQGAAALLSTPSDIVRFGAAMLEGRMIRAETLEILQTPVELNSGDSTQHGLGWFVRQIPTGHNAEPITVFGHEAISAGGTTHFLTVPVHNIVIVMTANVSHARNLSSLSARIADLFISGQSLDQEPR